MEGYSLNLPCAACPGMQAAEPTSCPLQPQLRALLKPDLPCCGAAPWPLCAPSPLTLSGFPCPFPDTHPTSSRSRDTRTPRRDTRWHSHVAAPGSRGALCPLHAWARTRFAHTSLTSPSHGWTQARCEKRCKPPLYQQLEAAGHFGKPTQAAACRPEAEALQKMPRHMKAVPTQPQI